MNHRFEQVLENYKTLLQNKKNTLTYNEKVVIMDVVAELEFLFSEYRKRHGRTHEDRRDDRRRVQIGE